VVRMRDIRWKKADASGDGYRSQVHARHSREIDH
jgi:hypothetical protein